MQCGAARAWPHFRLQERDIAVEAAEQLIELRRPRFAGALYILVATVRVEGNERRQGEPKVLRHCNRFIEEGQKLVALATR